jgi:YhcH/YjgK/YiaL family protein
MYADIQYVISGKELIGVAPLSDLKDVLVPYDAAKDVEFMTVNTIKNVPATPDRFFLFFPSDIHRPGMKDGVSSPVRKVVIKVKLD